MFAERKSVDGPDRLVWSAGRRFDGEQRHESNRPGSQELWFAYVRHERSSLAYRRRSSRRAWTLERGRPTPDLA